MSCLHRFSVLIAAMIVVAAVGRAAADDPIIPIAYGTWNPQPTKASLMLITSHPDDEIVQFGGLIPYYTSVNPVPMVHIAVTSGERLPGTYTNPVQGATREAELLNADWACGLRNEPIFARLRSNSSSVTAPVASTYAYWAFPIDPLHPKLPDANNPDPALVAAGYEKGVKLLATQIRTYKPDVIVTHDCDGEASLHTDHIAAAQATIAAFQMAANPSVDLDGLPAWQTQKLYLHEFNRDPSVSMINKLLMDWNTPSDALGGQTPWDIAKDALMYHQPTEPLVVQSVLDGTRLTYNDQYGLYATTVGADTIGPDGWAHGGFFEHVVSTPEPASWVLLALGLAGLLAYARRRGKQRP